MVGMSPDVLEAALRSRVRTFGRTAWYRDRYPRQGGFSAREDEHDSAPMHQDMPQWHALLGRPGKLRVTWDDREARLAEAHVIFARTLLVVGGTMCHPSPSTSRATSSWSRIMWTTPSRSS